MAAIQPRWNATAFEPISRSHSLTRIGAKDRGIRLANNEAVAIQAGVLDDGYCANSSLAVILFSKCVDIELC